MTLPVAGIRADRSLVSGCRPVLLAACLCVLTVLAPQASARQARVESTLRIPSVQAPRGRFDADRPSLPRARYRIGKQVSGDSVTALLAAEFGWRESQLAPLRREATGKSTHLLYQQMASGVPVWNRYVRVSLDQRNRVTMAVSGYEPDPRLEAIDPTPRVSEIGAAAAARQAAGDRGAGTSSPELVIVPGPRPALAWRVVVWPRQESREYEVLVDAIGGGVLSVWDATVTRKSRQGSPESGNSQSVDAGSPGEAPAEGLEPAGAASPVAFLEAGPHRLDGTGNVFDPDPLATSGSDYTPPYVDANDADSPGLTSQLKEVTLRDITQGSDGLYRLEGPYLRIVGTNSGGVSVYTPPTEVAPQFLYTRSQSGFEATNVYYHIDRNQRYVQSLGFHDLQTQSPLPVNPAGSSSDDSGWLAAQRYLFFGTGGVDDGEDAAVILHEYAHALLEAGAPGLRTGLEGQALHEGWADYWAMSYQRGLMDAGQLARSDWQTVFRWDSGLGAVWPGRRLDFTGRYPEATCSDNGSAGGCSVHNDGRLWGTVMMQIYGDVGREVTDRLSLLSHRYLAPGVTFRDAAEAVIQADIDHYDGVHVQKLIQRFSGFGLVDPASFGPIMSHDPLRSTEQVSGTRTVLVSATGVGAAVDRVRLHFRSTPGSFSEVPMTAVGNDTYSGEITLPGVPATITYFLVAVDAEGRQSALPSNAPSRLYSFVVGPDNDAPVIQHTPVQEVALAEWPPDILALVTDNLGVASVWVDYERVTPGGARQTGSFQLQASGDEWSAPFDLPVSAVSAGTGITYTLSAVDQAQAANRSEAGPYLMTVTGNGVLRSYDPEMAETGVVFSGSFRRAPPRAGTRVAPTGTQVFGTEPEGPYPSTGSRSSLELPALNLLGTATPALVFWQWYDTEHTGAAEPGIQGADVLWDGGNVKVSTDGGGTWSVLTPSGGYTGTIIASPDNPMSGESAFGGFSYGWRRVVMPIPASEDVRIRFDFGTDATNTEPSVGYAGWLLDDILLTTRPATGPAAPVLRQAPEAVRFLPSGEPFPEIQVTVSDDQGVEDVWLLYETTTSAGVGQGTLRLTQSPTSLVRFAGQIPGTAGSDPGDRAVYRVRLRDTSGNEVIYPAEGSGYQLVARLTQTTSLLPGASSPTWARNASGWSGSGAGMGGLVLAPFTAPSNGQDVRVALRHAYRFGAAASGRVEVSDDRGITWTRAIPLGGYQSLGGTEAGYAGTGVLRTDVFDLTDRAGGVIHLRLATAGTSDGDYWVVDGADVAFQTGDDAFELPQETVLHANFPDPFSAQTVVSYSLPASAQTLLTLHDMLGRRVLTLDEGPREAGTHTLILDAGRLSSGVYLLRLDTGAAVRFEMLTVAR